LQKKDRQGRDILPTIPQRRDVHTNDLQAIVQVFSKKSICDLVFKLLVCSCDNPGICFNIFFGTKRRKLTTLKYMKKFGLKGKGHITDFV